MLLGGVPGVAPAKVVIIGGGVVGTQAATVALGMGAEVTVLDRSLPRLRQLDSEFGGRLTTLYSSTATLTEQVLAAVAAADAAFLARRRADPETVHLSPATHRAVFERRARVGISGGHADRGVDAVDGLVRR